MRCFYFLSLLFFLFSQSSAAQIGCKIENLTIKALPCNGQKKFSVTINFTPVNPAAGTFKVQGNGIIYGTFAYNDLPITINGLAGNCTTPYEFVVRDTERPECSAFYELGKVCCTDTCGIRIFNVKQSECRENEFYSVGFDVFPPTSADLGFDVFVNGNFHSFHKYTETPIQNLKIPAGNGDQDTLVVCNNDVPGCCDTLLLNNMCACFIDNVQSQVIECNNSNETYFLRINFNYGTQSSDSFYIGGSSVLYGTFSYQNLPIVIGPLTFSQDSLELLIADKNNVFCFNELLRPGVPACSPCNLTEADYDVLPCNTSGNVYIRFTFKATNPGVKGFSVRGGGQVFGQFAYGEEFYFLGPIKPDCIKNYEFIIVDNSNPNCNLILEDNLKLCCNNCEIGELTTETFCTNTSNGISLQFNAAGIPDDSVVIAINGVIKGKFKKGSQPLVINYPFIEGQVYTIKVTALKDPSCFRLREFLFSCTNGGGCNFGEPVIEFTECSGDNTYFIFLKINPSGSTGSQFYAAVNDKVFGPLSYGQNSYTLGPLQKACNGIRIVLKDASDENCRMVIEREIQKCCSTECEIALERPEAICFENKIIGLKMLVKGPQNQKYNLIMNGQSLGTFTYSPIPVLVNITPRNEGGVVFKVIDQKNESCFEIKEYYLNCNNCYIENLTVKGVECTDTSFRYEIDFQASNTFSDSCIVVINNVNIGKFSLDQLPILSPPLIVGENQVYVIKILDAKNEACRTVIEVPAPECEQTSTDDWLSNIHCSAINEELVIHNYSSSSITVADVYSVDGKKLTATIVLNEGDNLIYKKSGNPLLVILTLKSERNISSRLIYIP